MEALMLPANSIPASRPVATARSRARGAVLFIALIVLVAMTLAGIAIMRSVDTATLIAGNIAFKQGTVASADDGIERAYQWLLANRASLATTNTAQGYTSNLITPTWTSASAWTNSVTAGTDPATGNTISYVIHRMCFCADMGYNDPCAASPTTQNQCALENPVATAMPAPEQGDSFTTGTAVYGADSKVYYRITVRSSGPRGTVSYIQAMVAVAL
jgi:Tfp pilus assembly protein PilX